MKHEFFLDWSPDPRDHAALLQRLVSANLARGGPSGYRNIAVILRDPDTGEASSGVWALDAPSGFVDTFPIVSFGL